MGITKQQLPQLEDKICITDGGMETDLVFHHQLDLPEFAAYDLLRHQQGYETLFGVIRSVTRHKTSRNLIFNPSNWLNIFERNMVMRKRRL